MSAADHRAEAVRCLGYSYNFAVDDPYRMLMLVEAQVHATLDVSEALTSCRAAFDALTRRHVELHEGVRELIAAVGPELTDAGFGAIVDRLRELAGEETRR